MTVKSDSNLTNPQNPVDNPQIESPNSSVEGLCTVCRNPALEGATYCLFHIPDPPTYIGTDSTFLETTFLQNDSNLNPDPPKGAGELSASSAPPVRKRSGGPAFHKPGCNCNPCRARRRKAEAESRGIRQDTTELATKQDSPVNGVINADLPPIVVRGRSHRDRIADWAIMRAADPKLSNKDIADNLGIGVASLNVMISRAVKEGWLVFDDPLKRLEHEILPTVTDNLKYWLKKKDKTVTIETAKGTLFPAYKEAKGIQEAPNTILAIKIEPAQHNDPTLEVKTFTGTIVGTPKGFTED